MSDLGSGHLARRDVILGASLGVIGLSGAALARATSYPPRRIDPIGAVIPQNIGEWHEAPSGEVRFPQGEADDAQIYDQLLTRYYTSPTYPPIMLLVAYGGAQSGDGSIHRPEICYPAAGYTLSPPTRMTLPTPDGRPIAATLMTAHAPGRREDILYWCRIGREFPASDLAQRLSIVRAAMANSRPDGALVRISTVNQDAATTRAVLERFAFGLLRSGDRRARQLLDGSS